MNNNPVSLLFNLTEAAAESLKMAVKTGVILAEERVATDRMDICFDCPDLDKDSVRCKKCGCFMKTKTRLAAGKCPIGKW